MAAPKILKTLGGLRATKSAAHAPLDPETTRAAIAQLQESLNELTVRYNAHTHGGVTAGAASTGTTSSAVNGTAQAAANLFTTN